MVVEAIAQPVPADNERLAANDAEIQALRVQINAKNAEIDELKANHTKDIDTKNAEINAKNTEIDGLKTTHAGELQALRDDAKKKIARIDDLMTQNNQYESDSFDHNVECKALKEENTALKTRVESLETKIKDLEAQPAQAAQPASAKSINDLKIKWYESDKALKLEIAEQKKTIDTLEERIRVLEANPPARAAPTDATLRNNLLLANAKIDTLTAELRTMTESRRQASDAAIAFQEQLKAANLKHVNDLREARKMR
jgi:chromosome segregation ATPase